MKWNNVQLCVFGSLLIAVSNSISHVVQAFAIETRIATIIQLGGQPDFLKEVKQANWDDSLINAIIAGMLLFVFVALRKPRLNPEKKADDRL